MKKIEDLLKYKLDDYKEDPSDKMWDKISNNLPTKHVEKRFINYRVLGYAASFILLFAFSISYYLTDKTYTKGLFSTNDDYQPIRTEELSDTDLNEIYTYENLKKLEQAYLSQGLTHRSH